MPDIVKITDLTFNELKKSVKKDGHQTFRAKQLWQWLYGKRIRTLDNAKNLPADFIVYLKNSFAPYPSVTPEQELKSPDDGTTKFLFRLADGQLVESVLIPAPDRLTVCLSTQVGCALGCRFCASTRTGFTRNLTCGEMVEQILHIAGGIGKEHPINNIVYMGIGEPFLNYDNVLKSIRILSDPDGLDIGMRKIMVSTAGILPGIEKLAKEPDRPRLGISLHAADNTKRSKLLPINDKYNIEPLIATIRKYCKTTGRQVSFEYILIRDFNDSAADARKLAELVRGIPCSFNLIPYNQVDESGFKPSTPAFQEKFRDILEEKGYRATLRRKKGTDINAACGQLRARTNKERKQTLSKPLIGTAFWLLRGKPLPDLARWVNDRGFQHLSLHPFIINREETERKELAAAVKELGLSLTYHGNVARESLDKNELDITALDAQLHDCLWWHQNAAPVSSLLFDPIHLPEPPFFAAEWNRDMICHAYEQLAPAGIRTGIENVYGAPGRYQSAADIESFRQLCDLPDQGILLDTGHANIHVHSPDPGTADTMEDYITGLPLDILEVHLQDNRGEKDEHKYLGYGNLDLAGLCKGLRAVDSKRRITLEICEDIQSGKYGVDVTRPEQEKWYLESRDLFLKTWDQTA